MVEAQLVYKFVACSRKSFAHQAKAQRNINWNSHISLPWMRWFSNSWHFMSAHHLAATATKQNEASKHHTFHAFVISHHGLRLRIPLFEFLFYIDFSNCWLKIWLNRGPASASAEWHDNILELDVCTGIWGVWGFVSLLLFFGCFEKNRQNCKHK